VGKLQLDTKPRKQIHGIRHTLLLFDAQAIPPGLEFVGEEHRTFHIMNIDENEYGGQGELRGGKLPPTGLRGRLRW
jgi:hypothetical protein